MRKSVSRILALLLTLALAASCAEKPSPIADESASQGIPVGITGHVFDGKARPATGAYVYAYRNMRGNLRGPADFEAEVDKNGRYFLDLVEGDYYLVARMRQSGADAGPPKSGDAWALPSQNPIEVEPGKVTIIDFSLQGIAQPMLMREGTLTSGETGFSGQLVDADNRPLPGAFVIAYPGEDFQRMPEATSPAVGDDGRFQLFVERPGQWCLAARTRTRGQPIAGEPYGKLAGGESGCLEAVTGRIIDVGRIRLTPYRQ